MEPHLLNVSRAGIEVVNSKFVRLLLVVSGLIVFICAVITALLTSVAFAAVIAVCLAVGVVLPIGAIVRMPSRVVLRSDGTVQRYFFARASTFENVGRPLFVFIKKYEIEEGVAHYLELIGVTGSIQLCESYNKAAAHTQGTQISEFLGVSLIDKSYPLHTSLPGLRIEWISVLKNPA